MCGLVGICSSNESQVRDALDRGLSCLVHRGPDDVGTHIWRGSGIVGLGLRRLAIQDLSPLGHQPMSSNAGRFVISFNGEITNFVELRARLEAEGHTFKSRSDTEVLLAVWSLWGLGCLAMLEGMFAFAVLDTREKKLTLVRDPFGIKPLFYSTSPDLSFTFSSELTSLLAMREGRPRMNWQRASDYLQWGLYDESNETFIDGVNQLLPGHTVNFDLDTRCLSVPTPYWAPAISTSEITFDVASAHIRELFLESVKRNLISDVPVGVALSGGIDSSAIARAIAYLEPEKQFYAFSYVAEGESFSELAWIDHAIKDTNAEFHPIMISPSDLANDLDELVESQGEPFGSTSIYAQWRVFKTVRADGIVVTLDGQGADEIFAGYHGYPSSRLRSLVRAGKLNEARKFLNNWGTWPGRSRISALSGALAEASPDFAYALLRKMNGASTLPGLNTRGLKDTGVHLEFPRRILDARDEITHNYLKEELRSVLRYRGLPALLRHGDRNSMSSSVESRVPFLDRQLVEFCLSLPEEYLIDGEGRTKSVLRSALRGLVPDIILDRRDKIGFETPQALWLKPVMDRHRSHLDDLVRSTDIFQLGNRISQNNLDAFWDQLQSSSSRTWRVINLLKWAELLDVDLSL